ncbi:zf-HC2 domain-containing protein [Nocardioides flavescens]|uniref:Zinc-finger n=1 Tax=Nocardioides flavescens TaxID=2691959 RepID=A0A6L7EZH6_9ACTN|nr:hypothetical protein [Nocardioides flavescens]MXG89351.1 hypothetical protein [Nocardioides flavescens]
MIGHLGQRVSALLDGQLSAEETERAWAHVHACHQCRDLVEHEGWVKTRLAGLSFATTDPAGDLAGHLKGALAGMAAAGPSLPAGDAYLVDHAHRPRRLGLVALGGGAAGAAVMGVLALGAAPADAPTLDRRAPVATVGQTSPLGFSPASRRTAPQP